VSVPAQVRLTSAVAMMLDMIPSAGERLAATRMLVFSVWGRGAGSGAACRSALLRHALPRLHDVWVSCPYRSAQYDFVSSFYTLIIDRFASFGCLESGPLGIGICVAWRSARLRRLGQ